MSRLGWLAVAGVLALAVGPPQPATGAWGWWQGVPVRMSGTEPLPPCDGRMLATGVFQPSSFDRNPSSGYWQIGEATLVLRPDGIPQTVALTLQDRPGKLVFVPEAPRAAFEPIEREPRR